jgi:hypothetical protein
MSPVVIVARTRSINNAENVICAFCPKGSCVATGLFSLCHNWIIGRWPDVFDWFPVAAESSLCRVEALELLWERIRVEIGCVHWVSAGAPHRLHKLLESKVLFFFLAMLLVGSLANLGLQGVKVASILILVLFYFVFDFVLQLPYLD